MQPSLYPIASEFTGYEEAIAAYARRLEEAQNDLHALKVLVYTRLHGIDQGGTYEDQQRALHYIERLEALGERL